MKMGMVMDILRGSVHDGPGIRTTVFLKGCPLHCQWCHNPEGMKSNPQLRYNAQRCIQCGKCVEICPQGIHTIDACGGHTVSFSQCIVCGKCVQACPVDALSIVGYEMTSEGVLDLVKKDLAYYRKTQGGITLSGGEPLMQPEFVFELLKGCSKLGIHTAIETAGNVPWDVMEATIGLVDLYLYDYKASTEEMQQSYVGGSRELILENLNRLCLELEKRLVGEIWLRCPIIPGINDSKEHFESICKLKEGYPVVKKVELMPYHELGKYKWEQVGLQYAPDMAEKKAPSKEKVKYWETLIEGKG